MKPFFERENMKTRNKFLMIAVMAIIALMAMPLSGCGSGFTEGAAVGVAATGALAGIQQAYQQQEEELIARQVAALERLKNAADDAEKTAAEAEVKALEAKLQENEQTMLALKTGTEAATTDWNDPASVAGFSNAAALALMAWYLRRKKE